MSCSTASMAAATACPAAFPTRAFRASRPILLGPQNHDIDGAETISGVFQEVSVMWRNFRMLH